VGGQHSWHVGARGVGPGGHDSSVLSLHSCDVALSGDLKWHGVDDLGCLPREGGDLGLVGGGDGGGNYLVAGHWDLGLGRELGCCAGAHNDAEGGERHIGLVLEPTGCLRTQTSQVLLGRVGSGATTFCCCFCEFLEDFVILGVF